MNARQFIKVPIQWLLLFVALCYGQLENSEAVIVVPGNSSPAAFQSLKQPQFITNRTCNAHRLYALDPNAHYDHFAKERCGRYVSHLIVRRSVIRYIPSNFFIHKNTFECLITLRMENVSLKAIYPHNFENITKLEVLQLAYNQIEHVPAGIFRHLPNLNTVDLSHNAIETIDTNAFRDCINLQHLQLNNNRLTVLDAEWMRDLVNIKYVDFSDNLIESDFDGDIFHGASGVKLFLRSNRIKRILSFGSKSERGGIFRLIDLAGNTLRPPYPIIPFFNHNLSVIY
ncbi:leucine-rich repeat-containing protein 70-like [Contarinia nasturtii]|uniref:leucine-rich repeat-containing protein 70-like n=1 Tax=Contarinia nasturtii TaxID=265458 RepID=UPI0012D385AE|nr:leucine-rich repeat-containing protein 70-like [Contarinia nasturtii]